MDGEEILIILAFVTLVAIPVLALTARFTLKPIVEAVVSLRRALSPQVSDSEVENKQNKQIEVLEREVADLKRTVEQLQQSREFERALLAPKREEPPRVDVR